MPPAQAPSLVSASSFSGGRKLLFRAAARCSSTNTSTSTLAACGTMGRRRRPAGALGPGFGPLHRRCMTAGANDQQGIRELLRRVQQGQLTVEAAAGALAQGSGKDKGYDAVDGYAKIDYAREARTGLPEVIYGEGKTPEQLLAILKSMGGRRKRTEDAEEAEAEAATGGGSRQAPLTPAAGVIVATRVSAEKHAALQSLIKKDGTKLEAFGHLEYLPTPRLLVLRERAGHAHHHQHATIGTVTVLCAGTADLSVAEEAAVIAELCGAKVQRLYDVGIAGIHRLFASLDTVRRSHACVAVAGMDGALPTVVAGLVQAPVIAVPTSVGYGVGANGLAPLMTMLNACAPGVAVVNIDNGLGAAAMAIKILRGRLREP